MLDIKLLRETPGVVRADLRKRGRDPAVVDRFLRLDETWRATNLELERLRAKRNKFGPLVGKMKQSEKAVSSEFAGLQACLTKMQDYWQFRKSTPGLWAKLSDKENRAFRNFLDGASQLAYHASKIPQVASQHLLLVQQNVPPMGLELPHANLTAAHELIEQLQPLTADAGTLQQVAKNGLASDLTPELRERVFTQVDAWPPVRSQVFSQLESILADINDLPFGAATRLATTISQAEELATASLLERDTIHRGLPNIMHLAVPEGKDDSQNVPIRWWGEAKVHNFPAASHVDLLSTLDLADLERAARAAGSRFFYLKGDLVLLGRALELFALQHLAKKGFTAIEPPHMLRREALEGAIDLADFESVIYRVEAGKAAEKGEPAELFLIATSEHPIAALHMGEIIASQDLPLLYAGVSPCYRKEAGAHGKDTKGIFRVHQFSKVEMFVYCAPKDSWRIHEELIANAEELYKALKIPYRVVDICTGDLGSIAARKYDLEAWMPVQGAYREVVSCSNCTDFQARRYNTRHRANPGDPTEVVHTLNSTAIAVQRTLVAILENFQQADGSVLVPEVLRPYVGKDRIVARPA